MSDTATGEMTGSCVCGAVSFRTTGGVYPMSWCHCTLCRKYHGHALAAVAVPNDKIEWKAGAEDAIRWYHTSKTGQRGGCTNCGSALFFRSVGEDHISIAAGILDNPTQIETRDHIYTADKGDWYSLEPDNAPRYEQHWPDEVHPYKD